MLIQGVPPKINNKSETKKNKETTQAGSLGLFQRLAENNPFGAFGDQQSGQEAQSGAINNLETQNIEELSPTLGLIGITKVEDSDPFITKDQRNKAARKWGYEILDKLDEIKRLIVNGHIPADKLEHLAEKAGEQKILTEDPLLSEILQDVQTRALVEVAKAKKTLQQ